MSNEKYTQLTEKNIHLIKEGTRILIYDGKNFQKATIKLEVNNGSGREFIINKSKNYYFMASQYLKNKSWARLVFIRS